MKNTPIYIFGAVVCSLVILVLSTACMAFLVPAAEAAGIGDTPFSDFYWVQTGGPVHIDINIPPPPPLPQPPYNTNNPQNMGSYPGPCPIGTTGIGTIVAPQLRDTGLKSGALCRGACGVDCQPGRCTPQKDIVIQINSGTCTYQQVVSCPTHKGCQDHDACYDYCTEKLGYTSLFDACHDMCNSRCFDEYGYKTCSKWADILGNTGSVMSNFEDWFATPTFASNNLLFSDPPIFTKCPKGTKIYDTSEGQCCPEGAQYSYAGSCWECPSGKVYDKSSSTCRDSCPDGSPYFYNGVCNSQPSSSNTETQTSSPSPTPSPTTSKPTPTPVVRKTVQEPNVTLTTMWEGNSQGDAIYWDPSAPGTCGSTTGESHFQCTSSFLPGTKVTLTAEPHEGGMFLGWFGACSGTGVCQITMDKDKTVTANFQMTPIATLDYNVYCSSKYPGSVYNAMTHTCQYQTVQTMTPSSPISPGGTNRPTLIPIEGECCPNEPCDTQVADATGGTPPYHYSSGSFANGAPPMGMIINLNGHLTGTAPAVGTYSFSICVADITGASDCKQTRIIVS